MATSILPIISKREGALGSPLESETAQNSFGQAAIRNESKVVHGNVCNRGDSFKGSESINQGSIDTRRFRNTFDHNLCLDLLKEGYHEAFSEIFNLIEEGVHLSATSDALHADEDGLLDFRKDKELLTVLNSKLIEVETSRRRGKFHHIYSVQLQLAKICNERNCIWLSEYFYLQCLLTSKHVITDGGRCEAEALCHAGMIYSGHGDFETASKHLSSLYEVSKNQGWLDSHGNDLHKRACCSLKDLYTTMAHKIHSTQDGNTELNLEYLQKAYTMAKESQDEKLLGDASFNLGGAYYAVNDVDKAIEFFTKYLVICQSLSDKQGEGKACQVLAKCHQRLGETGKAIELLKRFVEIAAGGGQLMVQVEAYGDIAAIHGETGSHGEACRFSELAFETAQQVAESNIVDSTRIDCGVALGNRMFQDLAEAMVINSRRDIEAILKWKTRRAQDVKKARPDDSPGKDS